MLRTTILILVSAVATLVAPLGTTIAFAQNDDLALAEVIPSLPYSDTLSNAGATVELGEVPASCATSSDGLNSIWWAYTPVTSGYLIADTDFSGFDTILSAYDGISHPLYELACDDNSAPSGFESIIVFEAVAGVTYYFRVVGQSGASGSVNLNVRALGDRLEDAISIFDLPFWDEQDNTQTGVDAPEPGSSCGVDGPKSIWWTYTATSTDSLVVNTDSSGFDTILSVFTGTDYPLTEIACDDDGGVPSIDGASRAVVKVTNGVTYHFRVTGYSGAEGTIKFNLQHFGDDVDEALQILALPFADTLHHMDFGSEWNESTPSCAVPLPRSVWWKYTPSVSGDLVVDTDSTSYDTYLSVHTGSSHPLSEVGCDNDSGHNTASRDTVSVSAGIDYYFRVAVPAGAVNDVRFNVTTLGPDFLAGATPILGIPYTDITSNLGATLESGESPATCGTDGGNSVWWSFTPSFSDTLIVDTDSSGFDTILSLHTGSGHPLAELDCDDDGGSTGLQSKIKFYASSGVTYFFRAVGFSGAAGEIRLHLSLPGDRFLNAILVPALPFADTLYNPGMGIDFNETLATCGPDGGASSWWSFTPTVSGVLVADTDSSSFNTILSVYTGTAHPLIEVGCDDDMGAPPGASRFAFSAVAGTTYHIRVTGFAAEVGVVRFQLHKLGDNLDDSIIVAALPYVDSLATLDGFGLEASEVLSCFGSTHSVWWSYTASFDGAVVADTDSSGSDTVLGAYDGLAHPLNELSCDDDSGSTLGAARVIIPVVQGKTYFFRVELLASPGSKVRFRLRTLDNDFLVAATPILAIPFRDTMSNVGATIEPGESAASCANSAFDGANSIWWRFKAAADINLTVDTDNSDFDTVLSLQKGSLGHPLSEIGCNDENGHPVYQSRLNFSASKDSTYYIRITGWNDTTGTAFLSVRESIVFSGKIYLEGAYQGAGTMAVPPAFAAVRTNFHPYSDSNLFFSILDYDGPETTHPFGFPANAIDWIVGSLRTGTAASTEVPGSKQALLVLADGSIVGAHGDSVRFFAPPGSYHVVLRHRNHLSVMSASAIDFTTGKGSWDFTSSGKAHSSGGMPMKPLGSGMFGMIAADPNFDGQITASDFNIWLTATKAVATGYLQPDLNLDAQTTAADFNLWLPNTKMVLTSQVPE